MKDPGSPPVVRTLSSCLADVQVARSLYCKAKEMEHTAHERSECCWEDLKRARVDALRKSGMLGSVEWILCPMITSSRDASIGDISFKLVPATDTAAGKQAGKNLLEGIASLFELGHYGQSDISAPGETNSVQLLKSNNSLLIALSAKDVAAFLRDWQLRVRLENDDLALFAEEYRARMNLMEEIRKQIVETQTSAPVRHV
jgi:hypothetical protein